METHILFFILAGLLIAVLVGASIWSARREKSHVFSNTFSTRPPATPINTSTARDISPNFVAETVSPPSLDIEEKDDFTPVAREEIAERVSEIKIRLPEQPPEFQPVADEIVLQTAEPEPEPTSEPSEAQMITLYVVAAEGYQFQGSAVIQNLEAMGLQFGEYHIFHRHFNNDVTSPVQFSVANMMQPGIFDLNNIEHFSTVGLVFFMQLPSVVGNDLANLKLMLRTAESFAQSMGGFVLTDQHQLFDDEARQNYLLRIHQQ